MCWSPSISSGSRGCLSWQEENEHFSSECITINFDDILALSAFDEYAQDSEEEVSHTSLCDMDVVKPEVPARPHLSPSSCNIVVCLHNGTCSDRDESTPTAHLLESACVREIHADATGGRGYERRSARGHKVRSVVRQCNAGTQRVAETVGCCKE